MKFYLIRSELDPNKFDVVAASGFVPENYIAECPDDFIPGDEKFVQLIDNKITVNLAQKAEYLAAVEAAEELNRSAENAKKALKDKFKALKKSDIDTVSKLGDAVLDLLKALDLK